MGMDEISQARREMCEYAHRLNDRRRAARESGRRPAAFQKGGDSSPLKVLNLNHALYRLHQKPG